MRVAGVVQHRAALLALGYQTLAGFALHLTTAIARPSARDGGSARRAIEQPAPKGINQLLAAAAAG